MMPKEAPRTKKLYSVLMVLHCTQVLCNLWALIGVSLVDSKAEFDNSCGQPKKVRQCHLSVAVRYSSLVARQAHEHKGPEGENIL
eukprot:9496560-Lingulodinium_polyedra.AAC.1